MCSVPVIHKTLPILPDAYAVDEAFQLTVEDDFSLYHRFDDLFDPIVKVDRELPSITESCYINREKVFGANNIFEALFR
jgi:hypothetical protein